jgi:hypothetical protein
MDCGTRVATGNAAGDEISAHSREKLPATISPPQTWQKEPVRPGVLVEPSGVEPVDDRPQCLGPVSTRGLSGVLNDESAETVMIYAQAALSSHVLQHRHQVPHCSGYLSLQKREHLDQFRF